MSPVVSIRKGAKTQLDVRKDEFSQKIVNKDLELRMASKKEFE